MITAISKKPDWIKKAIRNAKARERYFIKRYGNLDRMKKIEQNFQAKMDEMSFDDEMAMMENEK